ncbi:CGNR zinc finger domain-containing protein [Mycobacterium simiae]|uniref:CGNR zinc finger domain-containing protein n=1 Tax=Mycobacterium simiae TaxID=1784 RepID=UPI0026057641|nr:ABATE domain-containing protein [Mycobacterium simiae]
MSIRESVSLDDLQAAGFPMGAESSVALDLADTLVTVTQPATDLIGEPDRAALWWQLQAVRLPAGPSPDLVTTRRVRDAIRDLFDSHLEHRQPRPTSIEDINAATSAAPRSTRLNFQSDRLIAFTRWHTEYGGNAVLAAVAEDAIQVATDPQAARALRRCANPNCSMLFLATNKRRVWCTANICGNRARVARHYERTHPAPSDS